MYSDESYKLTPVQKSHGSYITPPNALRPLKKFSPLKETIPIHIFLDIDKTLAYKEVNSPPNSGPIGPAIPKMVQNVKNWLSRGYRITIWSARLSRFGKYGQRKTTTEINRQKELIKNFLKDNGLPEFDMTAEKYGYATHFIDDKAVPVDLNKGDILFDISGDL